MKDEIHPNYRYKSTEIINKFKEAYKIETFDKNALIKKLKNKNQTDHNRFQEIINNYQKLLSSYNKLEEKIKYSNSQKNLDSIYQSNIQISSNSNQDAVNKKIAELERELNESLKENRSSSSKLYDLIQDNIKLKDQLTLHMKQSADKTLKIQELTEEMNKMDYEIIKLKELQAKLLHENNDLENSNVKMLKELCEKRAENNRFIDEIITIKNDYAVKMNELMELSEEANRKKDAADSYFNEKRQNFLTNNTNFKDDFKVIVEESIIPNKLKSKFTAHNKNITGMKFNGFGSHLLSCSADCFIKYWDCSKSNYLIYYFRF